MSNAAGHENTEQLDALFQECLIDVILPDWTTLESLSQLDPDGPDIAEQLLRELGKRPHRTQAYYDENLTVLVKLELLHQHAWTKEQAITFFTSSALHISTEVHYLQARSAGAEGILGSRHTGSVDIDNTSLSVPSSPATFRGLGVRTPGFPYTPAPVPDLPKRSDNGSSAISSNYDDHTLGALIASGVWETDRQPKGVRRWIVVKDGRAFVIWRMPKQLISWHPNASTPAPIAVTATITLRPGSLPISLQPLFSASTSAPRVPSKDNRVDERLRRRQEVDRRVDTGGVDYAKTLAKAPTHALLSDILDNQVTSAFRLPQQHRVETARTLSSSTSRILKRAARRIMNVTHSLDVALRVRKHDVLPNHVSQETGTLCVEIANNPMNGLNFRIDTVEVKLDGSVARIQEVSSASSETKLQRSILLSAHDQHNLVFNVKMDSKSPKSMQFSSRGETNGLLPPSTPLAALLTPSQVLQSGRPLDPRMRMVRQPDLAAREDKTVKELQVTVVGCPVYFASEQYEETAPTAPFMMRWITPFVDNMSSPLAQEGKRRPASSPATVAASTMKKQATSIGVRSNGTAMTTQSTSTISGARPQSSIHAKLSTAPIPSQTLVQATAGSKRHTIAGLTQISQRMAYMSPAPALYSPLPATSERPSLSRQPSRVSAANIGIGQPPLDSQVLPAKKAIPPHMTSQFRPAGPASPKRSMSASALPTINTMFEDQPQSYQAPLSASHSTSPTAALASPSGFTARQSDNTARTSKKSPLRSFTELTSIQGRDGSPAPGTNSLLAQDTLGMEPQLYRNSGSAHKYDTMKMAEDNSTYRIDGKVLVSVAVLPSKETAASLGLSSEVRLDQGDEEGQAAMMRARLATFKLGTASQPSSPPLSGALSPQRNTMAAISTPISFNTLRRKGAVAVFDIFLIEIFILNTSNSPIEMILRTPISASETGKAGIMSLDNRLTIGPLVPQACQSVRMRFLALETGVHDVEGITIRDLATGREHSIRQPVTVVVA